MDAIMRLGGSDDFATSVNRNTPWQGFFYYFHFFPEQCVVYITAYLGIISRVKVAQMSNATLRNMKKINSSKILSSEIPLNSVAERLGMNCGRILYF